MNKIFKYSLLSLITAVGLASCSNDYEYDPAEALTNAQVYFPTTDPSTVSLSSTESVFYVDVARANASDALNVAITVDGDTVEGYEFPKSFSFAAGAKTAQIPVSYSFDKIGYDSPSTFTITFSDATVSTPYGDSAYEFTAEIPAPWTSLGTAKFLDAFIYDSSTYFDVEVQQNDLDPNLFRLVSPYDKMLVDGGYTDGYMKHGPSEYFEFRVVPAGSTYLDTQWTNGFVYFSDVYTGYYISDYDSGESNGEVMAVNPARFSSLRTDAGVQYNKVVEYQENGLPGEVELAPYYYIFGTGGWNYTKKEGTIDIIFPGFTKADLTMSMAYTGIFTDTADSTYACANLTLGKDVKDARAIVMTQDDDAAAVADALATGELEGTAVQSGEIRVPFDYSQLNTGKLQIVVAVVQDGKLKNYDNAKFQYTAPGAPTESWTPLYVGTYTYTLCFGSEDDPYNDEGLVLSQCDQDPSRYKISQVFYGVDFIFTMADDGTISFDEQYTGYTSDTYGDVDVIDMHAAYSDQFEASSYANGVFKFAIGYHCSAGWFGYGYENYTLTGQAGVKGQRKVQSYFQNALKFKAHKPHHEAFFTLVKDGQLSK